MRKIQRATPRGAGAEIERPRLIRRLRSVATYRVAVVLAPPGYGKSTLLAHFLQNDRRRSVMVRFGNDDRELEDVVRTICADASAAAPNASSNLAAALRSTARSPARGAELGRWFLRHLEDDGWLIALDDVHRVHDPQAEDFLRTVLSAETSNHWLIAARGDLGLPFAVWTATGQMDAPLDLEDLKFTIDDLAAYADVVGTRFEDEDLDAILAMTKAWPMAAAFAVRSSTRRETLPAALGETRELVFGYFAHETFAALTNEQRDVVVAASQLSEADVTTLEAAGFSAARWTFGVLAQRTSFVRRESADVYRLHDLFRDFLREQRDHVVSDERIVALALALHHRGDIAASLRLLGARKLHAQTAVILEREGFDLIENGQASLVAQMLSVLARGMKSRSPVIIALRAMIDANKGATQSADANFRRAVAKATGSEHARIASQYAYWLVARGESRAAVEMIDQTAMTDLNDRQRVDIEGNAALAYASVGDAVRARAFAERSIELARRLDDRRPYARALQRASFVAYSFDDYDTAERDAREAVKQADGERYAFVAARAYSILSAIAQIRDDLLQAAHYAEQMGYNAAQAGDGPVQRNAIVARFTLAVESGEFGKALKLREQLGRFPVPEGYREAATNQLAEATLLIASQRFGDAGAILERLGRLELTTTERALAAALEGCIAYEHSDENSARRSARLSQRWLAARRYDALDRSERRLTSIAKTLLAALDFALGKIREGRQLLDDVDRRRPSTALLLLARRVRALQDHAPGPDGDVALDGYFAIAQRLLDVGGRRAQAGPLTRMESLVLEHLSLGETDKEIATALGLKPFTVSNHVKSITSKLRCHGRYRAVVVARQLGYLQSQTS